MVAPTATTAGSFQITEDINFTITTTDTVQVFVLNEWVTYDGNQNFSIFIPYLSISHNGGAPVFIPSGSFVDNYGSSMNQVTANDGYFFVTTPFAVTAGDTVTLKAATYSLNAEAGFNPQATQTFVGSMFVTNLSGTQISDLVVIAPEPSTTVLLIGAGTLALAMGRRRKENS